MTTITLYRDAQGWQARWTGPGAADIRRLFDTDTLPTAYTPRAEGLTVQTEIQRLNPECHVTIAETVTPYGDR